MTPAELAHHVKLLEITARHLVTEVFAGEYSSAFKGRGMEFADVREYQPGDEVRTIDWNVTARAGKPFVKRFTEERELTIVLAVDCSASNTFSSTPEGKTKQELVAEIAALLSFAAVKKGDRVGGVLFTDRIEKYVPPSKGTSHAMRMVREVVAFDAARAGAGTDLEAAAEHLAIVLRRRAIVFFISDFLGVDPQSLRHLAARHEVIALEIVDPREGELEPAGILDLQDPETGELVTLDTSSKRTREAYRESVQRMTTEREHTFGRLGIDHLRLSTDRPFIHDLAQLFIRREHRR